MKQVNHLSEILEQTVNYCYSINNLDEKFNTITLLLDHLDTMVKELDDKKAIYNKKKKMKDLLTIINEKIDEDVDIDEIAFSIEELNELLYTKL